MSNKFNTTSSKGQANDLIDQENRSRKLLEMQRRFQSLQIKRVQIRAELQALESYMNSLDKQIQSHESYKKFSL